MAWLSSELSAEDVLGPTKAEPELSTLSYWVERLRPVVERKADRKTIVVLAKRCGVEPGAEKQACYAGTSTVLGVGNGEVEIWDIQGKGEERLLVMDTDKAAKFKLQARLPSAASNDNNEG